MDFSALLRRRRMTRVYRPEVPVPEETITSALRAAERAPSAGFSQGWDFVVLRSHDAVATFWEACTDPDLEPDAWLTGMRQAPALIVCLSDPERYLDRYAEPDKGWYDRSTARWPVPFWDTDVAMASLLIQLDVIDHGWGTCWFGVAPERTVAVRAALQIPADRRIVGVVSIGAPAPGNRSRPMRNRRRALTEIAHDGRFGTPWPVGRDSLDR